MAEPLIRGNNLVESALLMAFEGNRARVAEATLAFSLVDMIARNYCDHVSHSSVLTYTSARRSSFDTAASPDSAVFERRE